MRALDPTQLGIMLLALALLIGLARMLGEFARRLRQPAVLGELVAGIILGPTLFGAAFPAAQGFIFPNDGPNALVLHGISSLAIVLFLLVAGMEVDLSLVWKQGRSAIKLGVLATVIPFLIGLLAATIMPGALGRQPDADWKIFSLFFATAMSISALPVIAKTLMDLDLYRTDIGMVIISAAIFNDLIGWTVFAMILGMLDAATGAYDIASTLVLTGMFIVVVLVAGRWLINRALPFLHAYTHYPGGVLGFAVTLGLLGAAITEFIGIHAIFGAFIVGVALGGSEHLQERTRVMIDDFISFIFAPLFFASIGLRVNFLAHFDLQLVIFVLVIACFGKLLGAVLGAQWGGFPTRERWAVGFAMNARGAMEIILGTLALEAGIIHQELFVALVVMALVTSAAGGPLIRWSLRRRQPQQLSTFLSPKLFIRNLRAESRQDAIAELAAAVASLHNLDADALRDLAWKREQIVATGIGNGVAIPHARVDLKVPIIAVGISESGIPFDAPDGFPAHLVFLLLTPTTDSGQQLYLSASIAKLCREPRTVKRVLKSGSFTEFIAIINTSER